MDILAGIEHPNCHKGRQGHRRMGGIEAEYLEAFTTVNDMRVVEAKLILSDASRAKLVVSSLAVPGNATKVSGTLFNAQRKIATSDPTGVRCGQILNALRRHGGAPSLDRLLRDARQESMAETLIVRDVPEPARPVVSAARELIAELTA